MSGPTIKVQTWADDLRLPCFINAAETTGLLQELEPLRLSLSSFPFQSKHLPALKRNNWFVLRRPSSKERSGLVVVWPEQKCCVYISGNANKLRIALLRIRIDPQFLADGVGLTVFAATLISSTRKLLLEDTLMWKGRHVLDDDIFSVRWALAVQWIEHYCLLDPRLISGVEIEIAKWLPLCKLRPDHAWEIQPDEAGRKRMLWLGFRHAETFAVSPRESPRSPDASAFAPTLDGPLVAMAQRDSGPEQWLLSAGDGSSLGRRGAGGQLSFLNHLNEVMLKFFVWLRG